MGYSAFNNVSVDAQQDSKMKTVNGKYSNQNFEIVESSYATS